MIYNLNKSLSQLVIAPVAAVRQLTCIYTIQQLITMEPIHYYYYYMPRLIDPLMKQYYSVKTRLPFLSTTVPILYYLCLFHNTSLSLIGGITEQYPDVLNSPPLFRWLTPVHLADICMTFNQ